MAVLLYALVKLNEMLCRHCKAICIMYLNNDNELSNVRCDYCWHIIVPQTIYLMNNSALILVIYRYLQTVSNKSQCTDNTT